MSLHLVKLSVGSESVLDLQVCIDQRLRERIRGGGTRLHSHVTRMVPQRRDQLLGGGSIYWVVRGFIAARQRLVAIDVFKDAEGIGRCRLLMEPDLHGVVPRPCRPFQGWRYLGVGDAPEDLSAVKGEALPENLRRELAALCLL